MTIFPPGDEEFEARLKASVRPMTADEIFEQKVSFVYGQIAIGDPTVTKDDVRKRLEANR